MTPIPPSAVADYTIELGGIRTTAGAKPVF